MNPSGNHDGWKSTKEGQHFLVGKSGEIEGGFGGKYTDKTPSNAFSKEKEKTKDSPTAHGNGSLQTQKDPIVTKTGMTKSEVKELVLEFESLQDKMKKKYGKKAKIQQMSPSEYKRYSELATKMNAVPLQYRDRKNPKRFDSIDGSSAIDEVFSELMAGIDLKAVYGLPGLGGENSEEHEV